MGRSLDGAHHPVGHKQGTELAAKLQGQLSLRRLLAHRWELAVSPARRESIQPSLRRFTHTLPGSVSISLINLPEDIPRGGLIFTCNHTDLPDIIIRRHGITGHRTHDHTLLLVCCRARAPFCSSFTPSRWDFCLFTAPRPNHNPGTLTLVHLHFRSGQSISLFS